jgi:hypothetical protein
MVLPKNIFRGQSEFLSQWIRFLPYYRKSIPTKTKDQFEWPQNYLWQGAYRQRTLNGIWLPVDADTNRVNDAIDRLYLWTWWWMSDHPFVNSEKILWTLESILNNLEVESLGKETILLLRNALMWIVLIEPNWRTRVDKLVSRLSKLNSDNYPVLEVEFLLTQCFMSMDSEDLWIHLKKFPVFYKIFEEIKNNKKQVLLPKLQRRLKLFLNFTENKKFKLVIDVARNEIRISDSSQVLKSKPLVNLFLYLEKHGKARFEQILANPGSQSNSVNPSNLKEEVDPRKIYNLVVRARKITSNPCIKIRGQEVIRGTKWPSILIVNDDVEDNGLEELDSLELSKTHNFVDSNSYLQAAKALLTDSFNRKDMEKCLKVSKSTAHRMIEKWLLEKRIEPKGRAKATRYSWRGNFL